MELGRAAQSISPVSFRGHPRASDIFPGGDGSQRNISQGSTHNVATERPPPPRNKLAVEKKVAAAAG